MRSFYLIVKRIVDFLIAIVMLVVLLPLFAVVAVVIKLDSPGPVFFRQDRLGLGGKAFVIYKFRSMVMGAEKSGTGVYTYQGDARVTKVGSFIRKTSIDELPQLFNILKGEMSFVGPRPALYNQEDLNLLREQGGVHNIRPGITGWAQVNGRDELEIPVKVEYDIFYVKNRSLLLDIKIIYLTFFNVILGKGVVEGKTGAENKNIGA